MPQSQALGSENEKLRNKTRLMDLHETSLCQEEMANAMARTSSSFHSYFLVPLRSPH